MKRLILVLFLMFACAFSVAAQITQNQPKYFGKKNSNPNCASTSSWYFNTVSNEFRVCAVIGTPGTWNPLGGGAAVGGALPGATEGSVFFAGSGGNLAQDNANFFWDDTANQFKIRTADNGTGVILESNGGTPFYYPKLQFKIGAKTASIGGDYDGDLLINTGFGNYISFGLQGVAPNVRINSYSFGTLAAPNDDIFRIKSGTATDIPQKIILHGSQSADAIQVLASDISTRRFGVLADGAIIYRTSVNSKTANYTVLDTESGRVFTNEATTAKRNFSLPPAVANLTYTFYVQDADGLTVTAATGDTVRVGTTGSASGGNADSTTVGSVVHFIAINSTEWVAVSVVGTWVIT